MFYLDWLWIALSECSNINWTSEPTDVRLKDEYKFQEVSLMQK